LRWDAGQAAQIPEALDPHILVQRRLFPVLGNVSYARFLPGVEGIKYAAKVTRGLYRGGKPDEEGVDYLRRLGVRTVVSLRSHGEKKERALVEAAGMRYEWVPLSATHEPEEESVARFFEIVGDAMAYPIYVHCLHGVDRTGAMIALYRIRHQGWRNSDALKEMTYFGDHGFKKLRGYVERYVP